MIFRLDIDAGDYEQEDKPAEPKAVKVVMFAAQVLYRAIPFTGRGRPTKAKRKATWPITKSVDTQWPDKAKRLGPTEAKAQGEFRGNYTELDAPLAQPQGELRRAARRSTCSQSRETFVPGGDGHRASWADATDREFGP